jgi:hypothetical protein
MKTENRTVYIARDGREFPSEALCRAHERKTCGSALIGLTEAQIEAARSRADPDLADAIEAFGYELRKARQATGQFRRRPAQTPVAERRPETSRGSLDDPRALGSDETEQEPAEASA